MGRQELGCRGCCNGRRPLLALALAAALLAAAPPAVLPCGQHVVHSGVRSLVAMHVAHQAAHHSSGAWGPVLESYGSSSTALGGEGGGGEGGEGGGDSDPHDHDHTGHDCDHPSHDRAGRGHGHDHGDGHEHGHPQRQQGEDHQQPEEGAHEGGDDGPEHAGRAAADSAAAPLAESRRRRRRLQQGAAGAAAPLRLSVTYQRLGALDAGSQQSLTRVVEAVRRTLQKFISVKRPPSGGLLADPYCLRYSRRTGCTAYYPDFTASFPGADATCALATIDPAHVVNPANCSRRASAAELEALGSGAGGAASGAGGGASGYGSGCSSYTGGQGDATDMYLYITAVQNEDCAAGAAAWARPCLLDLGSNRPLLGGANICPSALKVLEEGTLVAVLAHEMIHALGFTESMFNLTRRPDGSARPLSEVVAPASVGGRAVSRLVTPRVQAAARAHFGCDGLSGAQLEEEGSEGSAGSHWEYNLFQGEVMVASTIFAADGSPPALSNLTLSYLEDTGWYDTNRSAAGLLAWGKGAGCKLPDSSCQQYMAEEEGQRLFCDPSGDGAHSFSCSDDYKATGVCRSLNFTSGCGLLLSQKAEQTCLGPNAANDMPDVFGWGTGSPSGRCLPVVYRFQAVAGRNTYTYPGDGQDGDTDAACFDTACSADGSTVYAKLFGQSFECPAGAYLSLAQLLPSRYRAGRIGPCPPASALCATQSCPAAACHPDGGDCVDGVCYCRLAFSGPACAFSLITGQAMQNGQGGNGTGGGAGGGAGASPPPPLRPWVQEVQLTLALAQPAAEVAARSGALAAALAEWAALPASAVRIAVVRTGTVGGYSNTTAAGGDAAAAGDASAGGARLTSADAGGAAGTGQAGQAYGGAASPPAAPPALAQRRRRQVLQLRSPPRPAPSPPAPAGASTTVVAMLTMPDAITTTITVEALRDPLRVAVLYDTLSAANFTALPGGLAFQTLISQVTVDPPPPSPPPPPPPPPGVRAPPPRPPPPPATTGAGSTPVPAGNPSSPSPVAAAAPAASDSGNSQMVLIIAIAAGGAAVVGILVAVVVVVVVRSRNARRMAAYYAHNPIPPPPPRAQPHAPLPAAAAPPPPPYNKRGQPYMVHADAVGGHAPPVPQQQQHLSPLFAGPTAGPYAAPAYPDPYAYPTAVAAPAPGPAGWPEAAANGAATDGGTLTAQQYYSSRAAALMPPPQQQQQQQYPPPPPQQQQHHYQPPAAGGYNGYPPSGGAF